VADAWMKCVHNCLKAEMSLWCFTSATRRPSIANRRAAVHPARPAPATMTSKLSPTGALTGSASPSVTLVLFTLAPARSEIGTERELHFSNQYMRQLLRELPSPWARCYR
jgi:hypothetical protein